MNTRWLAISIATGFLAVSGLVASAVLVLLPDQQTAVDHTAVPGADAWLSTPTRPGTPLADSLIPVPSAAATPNADRATPTSAVSTKPPGTQREPSSETPASDSAPLAGRIRPNVTYRGVATFYGADGGGNCMFDPSSDLMVAAMNHTDYEASKACGAYVLVRGPSGTTITVRITDQCPECAVGQLDLSAQAFAKLAPASAGQISITWQLLSPSMSSPVSIRYKSGSSHYWCGIQVINHRNPVARLEVRDGGSWRQLSRSDYNYFLSPSGSGCGSSIRITDIYGQRLAPSQIGLNPDAVQSTGTQFAKR